MRAHTYIHILTAYIHTYRCTYRHTDMQNTCVCALSYKKSLIRAQYTSIFTSVHTESPLTLTHLLTTYSLTLTGVARGVDPRDTNVCVCVRMCDCVSLRAHTCVKHTQATYTNNMHKATYA